MALSNDPMEGWLLVIDPPVGTWALDEPLLGLNVVLRLALTAQAAGARAVALADGPETSALRARLEDARLRIRVIDEMDRPSLLEFRPTTPSIRVPANVVVHRATLQALAEKGRQVELTLFGPDASSEPAWKAVQGAAGSFGCDPIVVTDRASAKVAREALLRSLRKTHDGWASTHLNRRISLSLTRWLVETPLRPNQVSVGILGVGLLGAWLASRGTYGALLAGAALFQAQSVLAAWGLYTMSGRALYLVLGAVTVMCGIVGSGLEYRYLIRVGSGDLLKYPLGIGKAPGGQSGPSEPPGGLRRLVDAISPLFKRDTFVLLTLVGAAIGWLGPFLALFAAGAVGVLFAVIGAEVRMARDRSTKAESSRQVDPVGSGD